LSVYVWLVGFWLHVSHGTYPFQASFLLNRYWLGSVCSDMFAYTWWSSDFDMCIAKSQATDWDVMFFPYKALCCCFEWHRPGWNPLQISSSFFMPRLAAILLAFLYKGVPGRSTIPVALWEVAEKRQCPFALFCGRAQCSALIVCQKWLCVLLRCCHMVCVFVVFINF
jgi:hypothetical protein